MFGNDIIICFRLIGSQTIFKKIKLIGLSQIKRLMLMNIKFTFPRTFKMTKEVKHALFGKKKFFSSILPL